MTIQDWGAIGEMIGGIAIIVSLLYVAVEIRHNTRATRAATRQAFVDSHGEVAFRIISGDMRSVFWRGMGGLSNLDEAERVAFVLIALQICRLWETYYYQRKEGFFEHAMWDGFAAQVRDMFSYPGFREMWQVRGHQFSAEFREFVKDMVQEQRSSAAYGENRPAP